MYLNVQVQWSSSPTPQSIWYISIIFALKVIELTLIKHVCVQWEGLCCAVEELCSIEDDFGNEICEFTPAPSHPSLLWASYLNRHNSFSLIQRHVWLFKCCPWQVPIVLRLNQKSQNFYFGLRILNWKVGVFFVGFFWLSLSGILTLFFIILSSISEFRVFSQNSSFGLRVWTKISGFNLRIQILN